MPMISLDCLSRPRFGPCCFLVVITLVGCAGDSFIFDEHGGDHGTEGGTDFDYDGVPSGDAEGSGVDTDGDADSDGEMVLPEDPEDPGGFEEPVEPTCDADDEMVLYLSADDSNSMAGPVIARQNINAGLPVTGRIRTYEFLNYYDFGYEPADPGSVSVTAQMRPTEAPEESDVPAVFDLQIGVRAFDQDVAERRPLNLTLSLDTSGSMAGIPIDMVRQSCRAIASSLREGDVISMVTWSTYQSIILESHNVTQPDDPDLVAACLALNADGGTDLNSGLMTAYRLARENFSSARINRVILMSDGGANVGVTSAELIAENADDAEGEAIYLLGVGMGTAGNYNDELMDTVTDAGKGAYLYIDSAAEARRMFIDNFLSNVEIAARDVQVELILPPTFDMVEFHGEEYSTDPEEVDPQHLAPNDAMIYHQLIGSCDMDGVDLGSRVQVTATFETPLTRQQRSSTFETNLGTLLTGQADQLLKGNAIVAYAQALDEVTPYAYSTSVEARSILTDALEKVESALETLVDDPDLMEIAGLLERYRARF